MQWQNRQNLRGERCKCTRPTLTPRIVFRGNFSARKITRVYLESRWGENVMPLVALTPTLPAYLRRLAYVTSKSYNIQVWSVRLSSRNVRLSSSVTHCMSHNVYVTECMSHSVCHTMCMSQNVCHCHTMCVSQNVCHTLYVTHWSVRLSSCVTHCMSHNVYVTECMSLKHYVCHTMCITQCVCHTL